MKSPVGGSRPAPMSSGSPADTCDSASCASLAATSLGLTAPAKTNPTNAGVAGGATVASAGGAEAVAPPLDPTALLWTAYLREPGLEPRNRLVECYQGLVRDIVRRFSARLPRTVDRGDLLTAGSVGLISAIASFDPTRGVRFESYGERRIKGALLDELRTQDWMPRPWRHRIEQHKRVLERLRSDLGRTPVDREIAATMGIRLDEYQLLFGVAMPGAGAGRAPVDDEDGSNLNGLDVVADSRATDPGDRLTREELLALVAQRLTDQEYRIVYLKYWEDMPLRAIGLMTGISESRVCKIHQRLLERLKDRFRAHGEPA